MNLSKTKHLDANLGDSGYWKIPHRSSGFNVYAARLKHTIFSVGYVVEEAKCHLGHVDVNKLPMEKLMSDENKKFLKSNNPMHVLKDLR